MSIALRAVGAHYDSGVTAVSTTPAQTVPAGVVAADRGFILATWVATSGTSAGTASIGVSAGGGSALVLDSGTLTQNMAGALFLVSDMTAGDTFTVYVGATARNITLTHVWLSGIRLDVDGGPFDESFTPTFTERSGTTSTTCTASAQAVDGGGTSVLIVSSERTTATSTTATLSSGSLLDYYEGTNNATCSNLLALDTGPAVAGTTTPVTITYTGTGSGNGLAIAVPLYPATAPAPSGPGLATTFAVSLSVDGVTFVDVTTLVEADPAAESGVVITPATPPTPDEENHQPGTAAFTIVDPTGTWWPDNPTSSYYPRVGEGMVVLVVGTVGTTSSVRHLGKVRAYDPYIDEDARTGAKILVQSADILADLANLTLDDRLSEELRLRALTATYSTGQEGWDVWPLLEDSTAKSLASSRVGSTNQAKVVMPLSGAGQLEFLDLDGASVDGPVTLPRMATFTPGQDSSGLDIPVTPVIECPVDATTSGQFYVAIRTTTTSQRTFFQAYDGAGTMLWSLTSEAGTGYLRRVTTDGSTIVVARNICDGRWHHLVVYGQDTGLPGAGKTWRFFLDGGAFLLADLVMDTSSVRRLVVGGSMPPKSRGKQYECWTGDVALIGAAGVAREGSVEHYCSSFEESAVTVVTRLLYRYGRRLNPSFLPIGTDSDMRIANGPTQAVSLLEAAQVAMRSYGGVLTVDYGTPAEPFSLLRPTFADAPWPQTSPSYTLTLELDDTGTVGFERGLTATPTRCTVTSQAASATFVDTATEYDATRPRRLDEDMATWNTAFTDAYAIAGGRVQATGGRTLHIASVGIDLTTSIGGQALADAVLAQVPSLTALRITEGAAPAALSRLLGRGYDDYVVRSWQETWTQGKVTFDQAVYRLADVPRMQYGSTAGYNRYGGDGVASTVNGSALGTGTATGLQVSTPGAGPRLRVSTPILWDWNGECVAGIASGTSTPQSVTITGRGQNGTVARTHTDVEPFDVWQPARYGY